MVGMETEEAEMEVGALVWGLEGHLVVRVSICPQQRDRLAPDHLVIGLDARADLGYTRVPPWPRTEVADQDARPLLGDFPHPSTHAHLVNPGPLFLSLHLRA